MYQSTKKSSLPSSGFSAYGVSISSFTPTNTSVILPMRSLADPCACGISLVSISMERY